MAVTPSSQATGKTAGSMPRAMILAAGFGTRLGSLTKLRPKPMLPVLDAPLVRWAVRWLAHHGVRDVVVNLHHLGEQIEADLGDGSAHGVSIQYSPEHGMILGTGGGLRQARPMLDDGSDAPIVVMNGKILLDLDLDAVVREHRARGAEATMVLRTDPNAERWGSLRTDARGRVVEFLGRPLPGRDDPGPPLMFTGVSVMQPRFLDRVPAQGEQCIVRTAYRELFDEAGPYFGHLTEDYWWEHSTPARYLAGVRNVLDGCVRLPGVEGSGRGQPLSLIDETARVASGAEVFGPVWIGPGATVEAGAKVGPHVQLGARSRVGPGVAVRDAIVWEDVEVTSDLQTAIAAGAGEVVSAAEPPPGS